MSIKKLIPLGTIAATNRHIYFFYFYFVQMWQELARLMLCKLNISYINNAFYSY